MRKYAATSDAMTRAHSLGPLLWDMAEWMSIPVPILTAASVGEESGDALLGGGCLSFLTDEPAPRGIKPASTSSASLRKLLCALRSPLCCSLWCSHRHEQVRAYASGLLCPSSRGGVGKDGGALCVPSSCDAATASNSPRG